MSDNREMGMIPETEYNSVTANQQVTDTQSEQVSHENLMQANQQVTDTQSEQVNRENLMQANQTYSYTKEEPEQKWQPNTGTYYTGNQQFNNYNPKKMKKKKEKKPKKPVTGGKLFAACTASTLAGILGSMAVMYCAYEGGMFDKYVTWNEYAADSIQTTDKTLTSIQVSDTEDENVYSVSQVSQAVLPSVVSITSTAIVEQNYNPFYGGGSYQVTGAGSGIIVGKSDTEILIVTNNHVVEDTTSLTIEFADGSTVENAYIKGTNSSNDVAVVAIPIKDLDEETINSISIAVIGDSGDLEVGESVIAIGNALGYGQSVTSGVVSALDREIDLDSGTIKVIQTDASINGGNSGGALVNRQGEVIGINVAKASQSSSSSASVEGMGYAIPISEVKDIIDELMNRETKTPVDEDEQGYLGITSSSYVEVDSNTSSMYNIPEGIYMKEINEKTPLDVAGVEAGDVITKVDGEEVRTYEELKTAMQYYAAGDKVTLTIATQNGRKYTEKKVTVTLVSYEELQEMVD